MTTSETHTHEIKEENFRGKLTSKELKDGPLIERRCTDILCLLVFALFWAGMIFIAYYSKVYGDTDKLLRPYDQKGAQCGVDNGVHNLLDYPYIFFIKKDGTFKSDNTVCIKKCATETLECDPSYTNCAQLEKYDTYSFLTRFCMPKDHKYFNSIKSTKVFESMGLLEVISDLKATWWMLIVVAIIALVIGFGYLFLIKYFAGVLVWGSLIVIIILSLLVGALCFKNQEIKEIDEHTPSFFKNLGEKERIALGCGLLFLGTLMLILLCCFRKKISLSVAVLKTSAEFIEDEKSILFVPPAFFAIALVFYLMWLTVFIWILSTNEITPSAKKGPIPNVTWTKQGGLFFGYYLVALLWNHAFIQSLSQFFIASSTCLWYFDQGIAKTGKSPLGTSTKRLILHMGSIAFGSFLIALFNLVKIVLGYVQTQVKKLDPSGNLSFVVKCTGCCIKCFEGFLKFLNVHAYIQIAMTGENFCQATQDAFYLSVRNAARFGLVHGMSYVFLTAGKLVIAALAAVCGYFIVTGTTIKDDILSPIPITIVFAVLAGLIGHIFMAIYGISADSIIHCFAMDEEIHEGDTRYAPEQLKEFFDYHAESKKLIYN